MKIRKILNSISRWLKSDSIYRWLKSDSIYRSFSEKKIEGKVYY